MATLNYITKDIDIKNKAVLHFGELFIVIAPFLRKPVSAEFISKQIKVKPSRIRAVLNKLYNHNLIDYKRSFDDDTGKYTYIWTLNHDKLKTFLKNYEFDVASEKSVEESDCDAPFRCRGCNEAYSFDSATDAAFKCVRCGSTIDSAE
ncbi:MAG: hypothetical protein QXU54_03020 [Candidatus Micrarchaeia archaeon]